MSSLSSFRQSIVAHAACSLAKLPRWGITVGKQVFFRLGDVGKVVILSRNSIERKRMLQPYWGIVSPCGKKRARAEWQSSDLIVNLTFRISSILRICNPNMMKAPRRSYRWLEIDYVSVSETLVHHRRSKLGKFSTWRVVWVTMRAFNTARTLSRDRSYLLSENFSFIKVGEMERNESCHSTLAEHTHADGLHPQELISL